MTIFLRGLPLLVFSALIDGLDLCIMWIFTTLGFITPGALGFGAAGAAVCQHVPVSTGACVSGFAAIGGVAGGIANFFAPELAGEVGGVMGLLVCAIVNIPIGLGFLVFIAFTGLFSADEFWSFFLTFIAKTTVPFIGELPGWTGVMCWRLSKKARQEGNKALEMAAISASRSSSRGSLVPGGPKVQLNPGGVVRGAVAPTMKDIRPRTSYGV